ncbi:nicotinamide-nucleotide amidase [Halopseudomonas litoralis]|uniref:Nicotinamide-nucleotide amidase n=1 Tax=Halopseudomonas litoralis TaxID=797277 RepID=A0A1H1M5P1_9GAMM|nr:nicotinamide-nucleotide amidohydrolase family protein [Halopseudomonas litoralis]SDR81970.1 nicotinamide-nucleotide amidase [Halopseudomonas litoralis]
MSQYDPLIDAASARLGNALRQLGLRVTTAESCTGGGIAEAITRVSGSSGWFDTGFVTYANHSKVRWVGVTEEDLVEFGAVSEPVVRAMAEGALEAADADLAVAVSGIAGPDGGTPDKPVGTVWFAWAVRDQGTTSQCRRIQGNRRDVRAQTVLHGVQGLLAELEKLAANRTV